jgi:hypothetical protein
MQKHIVAVIMKYIVFLAIIISAYYITATQVVMNGLNDLANTYQNLDTVAAKAVDAPE